MEPTVNKSHSQALDLLRFPLALVVLTIHIFSSEGITVQGIEYNWDNFPIFLTINHVIDAFIRGKSVPIYFFISGYVFFYNVDFSKDVYIRKLKNRTKTLLIPYIAWNGLMIIMTLSYYLPCFSSFFPGIATVKLNLSWQAILSCFWNSYPGIQVYPEITNSISVLPINGPLWFVRELIFVVICSPIIHLLIKRLKYLPLLILGVAWFYLSSFADQEVYALVRLGQIVTAFFFFSWGAYMSIRKINMIEEFNRYFTPSMIAFPVLCLFNLASISYLPEYTRAIQSLCVLAGLFFAYNLATWLLNHKVCGVNKFLASSSFFIYVAHWLLYINVLKLIIVIIHPSTDLACFLVYVVATVSVIFILLATFYLLKRFAPSVLKVLTGRK